MVTETVRPFRPAPWISYRTWRSANGEWRSFLSDERTHRIATFIGASSQLWSRIENGTTLTELKELAFELQVDDQIEDFLETLRRENFVRGDVFEQDSYGETPAESPPPPKLLEDADNTSVEQEVIEWVAQAGYLFGAHWEVTYRCNERCVHCYNPGAAHGPEERVSRDTQELSTPESLTLLDDLRDIGVFRLTISGGEVTLRRDFWEIMEAARERGFSVNLYTNGLRLDESACDRLARLWPTSVSVSIYSADAAAHDSITGIAGSFDRSVQALRWLHERGIKTYLKSTQMDHTVNGYARVHDLALSLGAGPEIDMHMSAAVDGATAPMQLAAKRAEELVVMAATKGSPLYVGDASSNWGWVAKDPAASVCGAAIGSIGISPTGAINTCNSMPLSAGTQREHGLRNLWKATRLYRTSHAPPEVAPHVEAAASALSRWQGIRLSDFRECGTHRRCGWCTKCPGLAMLEHGDPLAPSTVNCRLAMARQTAADLLSGGVSVDEIANTLGVRSDFGRQAARKLPILRESTRGNGFDPVALGAESIRTGASAANLNASVCGESGEFLLRNGTVDTAEAIKDFLGIVWRFSISNSRSEG